MGEGHGPQRAPPFTGRSARHDGDAEVHATPATTSVRATTASHATDNESSQRAPARPNATPAAIHVTVTTADTDTHGERGVLGTNATTTADSNTHVRDVLGTNAVPIHGTTPASSPGTFTSTARRAAPTAARRDADAPEHGRAAAPSRHDAAASEATVPARASHAAPTGGDITDCLSNSDIDHALAALLGPRYVNALLLHSLRVGNSPPQTIKRILGQTLLGSSDVPSLQWVFAPLHVRHHWCGVVFHRTPDVRTVMSVFDSAPSPVTRRDIRALAARLGVPVTITTPARQMPRSNECGLFTILFGIIADVSVDRLVHPSVPHNGPIVNLHPWRRFFASKTLRRENVPDVLNLVELPRALWTRADHPAATAHGRRSHDPYLPGVVHGGASNEERRVKLVRDARPLEHAEIRRRLAGVPVGTTVRVMWRPSAAHDNVFEWFGVVLELSGSSRAPRWRVEYFADAQGPLVADDDTTFVREDAVLPPPGDGVEIIDLGLVDAPASTGAPSRVPPVNLTVVAPIARHDVHAARDDAHVPVERPQISPYEYVPDEGVEVDPALWPAPQPDGIRVTSLSGRDFLQLHLLDEADARRRATPLVWAAVTEAVRRRHIIDLRCLRDYVASVGDCARTVPFDALLTHYLQAQRHERSWHWSTLSRHAAGLVGALVALPLYAVDSPSVNPTAWPHFRAALQTAKRLTVAQGPREPVVCTASDVSAAVTATASPRVRALLILCWFSGQRPCDVIQMKKQHLEFLTDDRLRLRITRGKTVASQGAHHIHTSVQDPNMMKVLRAYYDSVAGAFLFPVGSAYHRTVLTNELRCALRAARPELESRSLRRGTLCCMAAAGATEQELLQWSRHTTAAALRRYLYFEQTPHAEHQQMQARAATALLPPAPPTTPPSAVDASAGFSRGPSPSPPPPARSAHPPSSSPPLPPLPSLASAVHGYVIGGGCPPPPPSSGHSVSFEGFLDIVDGVPFVSSARAPKPPANPSLRLPLHVKLSARSAISIDAVDTLARDAAADDRDAWLADRETLFNNDGRYDRVPWNGVVNASTLSREDVHLCLEANLVALVPPTELHRIRGSVITFATPELAKLRRRRILWTKDFNDTYATAEVAPDRGNATRETARGAILGAAGCISLDMSAYFDFIPVSEDVSWFECFSVDGDVYRNTRAAMGKRSSTSVATSLTRVLLSFPHPEGVSVHYATDGVRFAGSHDGCVRSASRFVQRARFVGAVINELDIAACTEADIAALWSTRDADFLGDIVDYDAKTIRCRDRHVSRLRDFTADAQRSGATFAALFRLWAMILYMGSTLGVPRDSYYATRAFFSTIARRLATCPRLWPTPCDARPPAELFLAAAVCAANVPARLVSAPTIDTVSVVDACALGYAGITCAVRPDGTFSTTLLQRRWDAATLTAYDMAFSTNSEPEALARVAEHVFRGARSGGHLILSDHEAFVNAFAHGSSPSPFYNSRVRRLRCAGVDAVVYTPGDGMLADSYSRFALSDLTDEHRAAAEHVAAAHIGRKVGRDYRVVG